MVENSGKHTPNNWQFPTDKFLSVQRMRRVQYKNNNSSRFDFQFAFTLTHTHTQHTLSHVNNIVCVCVQRKNILIYFSSVMKIPIHFRRLFVVRLRIHFNTKWYVIRAFADIDFFHHYTTEQWLPFPFIQKGFGWVCVCAFTKNQKKTRTNFIE